MNVSAFHEANLAGVSEEVASKSIFGTRTRVFLVVLAIVSLPNNYAFAGACEDAVQGKIAWNYSGNTAWNTANVRNFVSRPGRQHGTGALLRKGDV